MEKNKNLYNWIPVIGGLLIYLCLHIVLGRTHPIITELHANFEQSTVYIFAFALFFLNALMIVILASLAKKKSRKWIIDVQSILVRTVTLLFGFLMGILIFRNFYF